MQIFFCQTVAGRTFRGTWLFLISSYRKFITVIHITRRGAAMDNACYSLISINKEITYSKKAQQKQHQHDRNISADNFREHYVFNFLHAVSANIKIDYRKCKGVDENLTERVAQTAVPQRKTIKKGFIAETLVIPAPPAGLEPATL